MSCQFGFEKSSRLIIKNVHLFSYNLRAGIYFVKPTKPLPLANIHAVACLTVALAFTETMIDQCRNFRVTFIGIPIIHRVYKRYFRFQRLSLY